MYILHKEALTALRAIATLVVMALVLWAVGLTPFQKNAEAANLVSVSDTLSDSAPSVGADQTIQFTVPSGVSNGQTIVITYPGGFGLGAGLDFNDMDVIVGGNNITLAAAPSGTTWGVATTSNSITFTTSTTSGLTVGATTTVVIKIGLNASFGGTGNTRITNPSTPGSYQINIGGTMTDSGATMVAILNNVLVTANVNTSFTFVVQGTATSSTVNGSPTTTAASTTATTLPFGTLAAGVSKTLAQDLFVTTNAVNGFVVTVQQSQNLQSSNGADIDGFANGAYTNTPTAWTAPTAVIGNEATWGHWGLTSDDDLNGTEFTADKWVAASTTPRQIFQNSGPADGTTNHVGKARVGYQAQISALQEAANDYNTTLTYVATPTF